MSDLAARAERDLNSYQAKQGLGSKSNSGTFSLLLPSCVPSHCLLPATAPILTLLDTLAEESGVNENVERKFPSAHVQYGNAATTGSGDNKTIPEEEGGERDARGRYVIPCYIYI